MDNSKLSALRETLSKCSKNTKLEIGLTIITLKSSPFYNYQNLDPQLNATSSIRVPR